MKRLAIIFGFSCLATLAFSQGLATDLIALYEQGAYEKVIELGDQSSEQLDRDGWFVLGLSYQKNTQGWDAIRCFTRSIDLDPFFADGHYYLGSTYFYQRDLEASIYHLKKAYHLQPFNADYASFLGEVFTFQGMIDSAIVYSAKAIQLPACPARVYSLLGQLYYQRGKVKKALNTYDRALKILDPSDDSFWDALYTMAQIHYLEGDFESAEQRLKDFLEAKPEDFHALSKLIQVHFAQGEYDQGNALKPILYRAYQQGKLPPDIRTDGFCFDQFKFEEKKILAFEQFQDNQTVYTKHTFFVTNEQGEIICTFETQCNQKVRSLGKEFVLLETKEEQQNYYYQYLFDGMLDYDSLKKAILKILKGKSKPQQNP